MTQEMKIKREELKGISRGLQQLVKEGVYHSVNDALVCMYAQQGHTEIHSYKQWKEKGYQVKRGSKALMLWGEPRKTGKQETPQENTADTQDDGFKFWPLAYVFSQLQVEPCIQESSNKEIYTVTKFYADTPAGTKGTAIKKWIDKKGYEWITLFFGKNQSNQKLKKTFPANVLCK